MTDPVESGGNAPAAEPSEGAPQSGTTQPFGAFGATRGSGLARGKRSTTPPAASAAPATSGEYKPTALEVITPEREYKNPFGGDLPAEAPAKEGVVPQSQDKVETPPAAPASQDPAPKAAPADLFPLASEDGDLSASTPMKAELNILPPAETKRPALNWESAPPSAGKANAPVYPPRPARDERQTFRPEPRSDQRPDGRPSPRPEGRDFRPQTQEPRREYQPRRDVPSPTPQKSGGFLAWLKSLFGGKKAVQSAPEVRGDDRGFNRDGNPRRRRRGGRGRSFGERSGGQQGQQHQGGGEARFQGGERQGDEHGGHRPRRHRGGRGRGRGDHGGGPRSEGHQGGGAI